MQCNKNLAALFFCVSFIGCTSSSPSLPVGGSGSSPASPTAPPSTGVVKLSIDCQQQSNPLCSQASPGEANYNGVNSSDTTFYGFADPSIRLDPNSANHQTFYMVYSYPRQIGAGATLTNISEIHLTESVDGGSTWSTVGGLYTTANTVSFTDSTGTNNYYASNEVANILPVNQAGNTVWYAVHMAYLNKAGNKSTYNDLVTTGYMSITTSTTGPLNLTVGAANEGRLGFTSQYTATNQYVLPAAGQYLSNMDPSLANCATWNEPALIMQNGTLYLAAQCMYSSSVSAATATSAPAASYSLSRFFYAVFSTTPAGTNPSNWTWKYVGSFAGNGDAVQLAAQEGVTSSTPYSFITELDLALSNSGSLIAIFDPAALGSKGELHYGCRALEMNPSMSSPGFLRDSSGNLIEVANVGMSDDMPSYSSSLVGTGACGYDPASKSGIIIGRKTPVPFTMFLYSSFIAP